jgi:hypothetical protein
MTASSLPQTLAKSRASSRVLSPMPLTEILALLSLRGRAWIRARDAALRRRPFPPARRHPDPRVRAVAAILDAWRARGREFRAFLRQIDDVDVDAESRTRLGMFGPVGRLSAILDASFGDEALPFCWERAIQHTGPEPGWRLHVFTHTLRRRPSPLSVDPLLWALDAATQPGVVDSLHQTLIAQPFRPFRNRLEAMKRENRWRAFEAEDLLARM